MAAVDDVDDLMERYDLALGEFVKGNPEPVKELFSHREDVTLANPIAPPARGWERVAATMERAVSNLKDGEISSFETVAKYVTPELAYVVWIERNEGRVGESQDRVSYPLRVTMIFRPEDGTWKIVHRHADTVTSSRPVESLIQA